MQSEVTESLRGDPIWQLSVYADNRVGRLNELIGLFGTRDIHVLALSTQDSTDSTIIRVVVDYPEEARKLLDEHGYFYTERCIVAVEIDSEEQIKSVTAALVEAEINIYYVYSFLMRPHGKSALAISLEDNDLATDVLQRHQLKVLDHADLAR